MLTCNYQFKLKPTKRQIVEIEKYLTACRKAWNYALAERKDWSNSRKSDLDKCSLEKEYIISADTPYPSYKLQSASLTEARKVCPDLKDINAQVLQQVLRQLDRAFAQMKFLNKGFPRFKNKYRMRSFVFPQFKTNNRHKLNRKIARLHQTRSDTRKDFHYKLSHRLCDENGMIFVEDIDFKAWGRNMLCKHNLDASFGQFFEILSHVCWKRDVYFAKVDKNYTSQICPNCGVHTGKKKLSERIHTCPECGFSCNRDFAASLVIKNRGLSAVGQSVLENACGDGLSGFDSNIKLGKNL